MDGYGKRVLVVDGDEAVRQFTCLMLLEAGYNVYEADTCDQAVAEMRKRRFDAVVTDYMTPRTDGMQFLDTCRILWPMTPVIIMSRDSFLPRDSRESVLPQAYAVIRKPFEAAQLVQLVHHASHGRSNSGLPESLSSSTFPRNRHHAELA